MGRELKFRAWDGHYKKWLMPFEWPYGHSGLWLNIENGELTHIEESGDNDVTYMPVENITLCQFTGLLDKNGKEIYEGDYLSGFSKDIGPMWIVWEDAGFYVYNKFNRWGPIHKIYDHKDIYTPEVIGSIYENPELLNL